MRSHLGALVLSIALPLVAHAQLTDVPPEPPLPPPPAQAEPTPPPPATVPAPASTSPRMLSPTPPAPPASLTPTSAYGAPTYQSRVAAHIPSPTWTQDRSFTSTRFWLLDPGQFEAEVWWRGRWFKDSNADSDQLFLAEVMIGVVPHLQIDIYENLTINPDPISGQRTVQQEGNQIEARIAIPSYYGQIFSNPVIYLEWHPRHNNPDRAEVRLLLGGAPTERLYVVANPYVESNIESTDCYVVAGSGGNADTTRCDATSLAKDDRVRRRTTSMIYDMEFGTTVAAGYRVTDTFRVSFEAKVGWDMLGSADNSLHFVAFAGPGLIWKPLGNNTLKIMGTLLYGLAGQDAGAQQYEPVLIVGSQW